MLETTEARRPACWPMRLYRPKKWFSKKKIFCSPWLWIPFPKSGRRSMKKAMIGYCLINPDTAWEPARVEPEEQAKREGEPEDNIVRFDAGVMTHEEINALLNTLPLDITFVGKDDTVRYFTQGKERIFARPKTIIGRHVQNCHPPASVHIVEKIVEDLKSGKKDHEDFWIRMGDDTIAYIRYFAVRNAEGEYLGVMEISQNIKPIQELSGEKRLLSD